MTARMKAPLAALLAGGILSLASSAAVAQSADLDRSTRVYDTYCAQCHGIKRNGKGINSAHLSVQPRDHTDPKGMGDMPDDQIFKAIKSGGLAVNKSVLMPAWGDVLSDDEIKRLVAYLRHVCNCGPKR